MKGLYVVGVISGIAGVASIIYGLTQGKHGSSAITSGIILLVVAASTIYAMRGTRAEPSGGAASDRAQASSGRAQGLAPRQVYLIIGLTIVFAVVGFIVADAIGAPTTGPGPPGVITLIGCIVACIVYSIGVRLRKLGSSEPSRRAS
jgi:tellurite resistance protein TehA-like permease